MRLQTCIIMYFNRFNWEKINSKLYFTTKPNGHLRHLIPPSSFHLEIEITVDT